VLSTWSANAPCAIEIFDQGAKYCWIQGTSMAGPHAAGLAALLLSKGVAPRAVEGAMEQSANPLPCPTDMSMYADFPQFSGEPQECTGGPGHNSFYGAGEIDALAAVR